MSSSKLNMSSGMKKFNLLLDTMSPVKRTMPSLFVDAIKKHSSFNNQLDFSSLSKKSTASNRSQYDSDLNGEDAEEIIAINRLTFDSDKLDLEAFAPNFESEFGDKLMLTSLDSSFRSADKSSKSATLTPQSQNGMILNIPRCNHGGNHKVNDIIDESTKTEERKTLTRREPCLTVPSDLKHLNLRSVKSLCRDMKRFYVNDYKRYSKANPEANTLHSYIKARIGMNEEFEDLCYCLSINVTPKQAIKDNGCLSDDYKNRFKVVLNDIVFK